MNIFGYGFKSSQAYPTVDGNTTLTTFRVIDGAGTLLFPTDGNGSVTFDIKSDTLAVLPLNAISSSIADGSIRRLRVARVEGAADFSTTNNIQFIANITTKPTIDQLISLTGGTYHRDKAIEMNGTALNTTYAIELVNADGTSLSPGMVVNLPAPGVTVDDNGTRIQISSDIFFTTQADPDSNGTANNRKFKVYNDIGTTLSTESFTVNAQPTALFIAGFTSPNTFNRHQTTGDDVTITGTNLRIINEIVIVDENGTALTNTPNISLPHPGVAVTDNSILIDTSVAQFENGGDADSATATSIWRRFRLNSVRDTILTPQSQRFYVGIPPTYTEYSGLTGTTNYRRDNDTMVITGTGLGVLNSIEIVNNNGNTLAAKYHHWNHHGRHRQ